MASNKINQNDNIIEYSYPVEQSRRHANPIVVFYNVVSLPLVECIVDGPDSGEPLNMIHVSSERLEKQLIRSTITTK